MSEVTTNIEPDEDPSAESLREIPEIDFTRVRSLGRGLYAARIGRDVHYVPIADDVWRCFGSTEAVNSALRILIEVSGRVQALNASPSGQ